ncbi:unnamed protein product [Choristocarpus tenellus]
MWIVNKAKQVVIPGAFLRRCKSVVDDCTTSAVDGFTSDLVPVALDGVTEEYDAEYISGTDTDSLDSVLNCALLYGEATSSTSHTADHRAGAVLSAIFGVSMAIFLQVVQI